MPVPRSAVGLLVALAVPWAPAAAAPVDPGDEVVGQVTGHLTRAFADGPLAEAPIWMPDVVPGPDDADVTHESVLANVLAEQIRSRVYWQSPVPVDLGVVTPTALRGDLWYDEPDPDWGGEWWDPQGSLVRRAELEAVLPSPDEVWLTTLTGAQLVALLEEQWPTAAERPAVHLGLSAGASYAYDATRPPGARVTRLLVGGDPVDPTRPYRVAAPARLVLGDGTDGFTGLTTGADPAPTGLTDREILRAALHSELAPDHAERAIGISGLPATIATEQVLEFRIDGLGLRSHGVARPEYLRIGLGGSVLQEFYQLPPDVRSEEPVDVSVPVPAGVAAGPTVLRVVVDERTTVEVPATVATGRRASTTEIRGDGSRQVYSDLDPLVTLRATVAPFGIEGVVDFVHGGRVLASLPLVDGVATYRFTPTTPVGDYRVTARYRGNEQIAPSESGEARVTVSPVVTGTTLAIKRPTASWLPAAWASDVRLDTGAQAVGYVELREGTRVLTRARVVRGLALGMVPSLPAGAHHLTAVFVPDARPNVLESRSVTVTYRR